MLHYGGDNNGYDVDDDDNDVDDVIFLPIYHFYLPLSHHVLSNITVSSNCSYCLRVID